MWIHNLKMKKGFLFFDFLPENTVVWLQDHDWCKERLMDCEEELGLFNTARR